MANAVSFRVPISQGETKFLNNERRFPHSLMCLHQFETMPNPQFQRMTAQVSPMYSYLPCTLEAPSSMIAGVDLQ